MIGEMLSQYSWLWPLAWQSTASLAVGLAVSWLLRNRPVRAHQVLLLALAVAVFLPAMSLLVRQHRWGLLAARPVVVRLGHRPFVFADAPPAPQATVGPEAIDVPADSIQASTVLRAPVNVGFTPTQLLLACWVTASSLLAARCTMRFSLGWRLARRSEPSESEEIAGAIKTARRKLRVETDVLVRRSRLAHSPVIWCWGKQPILLVPDEQQRCDSIDWESVVCHELAHWKRRDHLTALFAEVMACALPWQLLLWLVRQRLIDLSEEACDDWVVASGQIPTRYARTLLGLTPQGHAALVPAVVSSRKGLAGRVRRIITARCASPHSDRRWTLAATILASCLAAATALAQAGASHSTDMVKTLLGHGAVVEQLPSARMIEGVVLDPNGEPIERYAVCVTALPMTTYAVEPDSGGHFRVPWSPAFASESGESYLLVSRDVGDRRDLAALVAIRDLALPVTVHLEPAIAVDGEVVDSDGQPIASAVAIISLPAQFKCRAPVAAAITRDAGIFSISCVPCGHAYTLHVRAEGYETAQLLVDATDTGKRTIDVGKITLSPDDPATPDGVMRGPQANWRETFQQAFCLGEGEVLRLVKPPLPPVRQENMFDVTKGKLEYCVQASPYLTLTYYVEDDGRLTRGAAWAGSFLPRMKHVVNWILQIPDYDISIPEEWQRVILPRGDYVVRKETTTQERLRALERIIQAEMHRSIRFEKRVVERDTIVVTGRYAFTPWPGKDPTRLVICTDDSVHMHEEEAKSLARLFERMADEIDVAIEDRAERTTTAKIQYLYDYNLLAATRTKPIDMEKELPALLNNLARQTGLTFKVEKQPREVWLAVEDSDT
ncbi:MAG: carboxypeptidase regulatory-like domain-containing protein [Sedimentisphaerales bacterium]|nr:carboxypeptidase regulatory-like domain-containing protein [Sedimentisphaerales bacterium]